MDHELALSIAGIRLLQTWHLLNTSLGDHHDQEALSDALGAIHTARASIARLVAGLDDAA